MRMIYQTLLMMVVIGSIFTYLVPIYGVVDSYKADLVDDKLIINFYHEDYRVGKVIFRPIYTISQVKQVYDYLIEIDFYLSNITESLGGEPIDTYFKVNYGFLYGNKTIKGDKLYKTSIKILLSSFAVGVEDLVNLSIEELIISMTAYTLTNSFTIPIDVASIMEDFNMPRYLIVNLNRYWVEIVTLKRDPGWVDYELYTSVGKVGLIRISSNKYFNFTRSMRILYDLVNKDFKRFINVSMSIEMIIDGGYKNVTYDLSLDNEVILPKDYLDYIEFSNLTITHLWIVIDIPYGEVVFDVIEDTGAIYIYGGRGINIYDLEAQIESFKELGNGWLLITLGIYEDIAVDNLKVYFDSLNPEMRPMFMKVFVKETDGEPRFLVNLLTFYDESGVIDGYIVLDLSTKDFIKRKELQFSMLLKESGEYKPSTHNTEANIALMDGRYTIEIPINVSLKYKDTLEIEVTLKLRKEGYNPVSIIYELKSKPLTRGSTDYFNLKNSTNTGRVQFRFQGEIVKTIKLYPLPPLEQFCGGGLSRGESQIESLKIYIDNVESLEIVDVKIMFFEVTPPDEYPSICNIPEKGFNPFPLLINIGIPTLAIFAALIVSSYIYLKYGRKRRP